MVAVRDGSFQVRAEWIDAPGVATPELAATWARYEVWVQDRCATQVEAGDSTLRRSVYGSLYPLAEWVVANWWALRVSIRPSSVDARYWNWANVPGQPWLKRHNLRGAGDGMAWPNLTLVPEGSVTRVRWFADADRRFPVRFATTGDHWVPSPGVADGLTALVENVLARLGEAGVPDTQLAADWHELGQLDGEDRDFCVVAAQLGLDPFRVDDRLAAEIVGVADRLPPEVASDFFDNADVSQLSNAAAWTEMAAEVAVRASADAAAELREIRGAGLAVEAASTYPDESAWSVGYRLARRVRSDLDVEETAPFDVSPWLGIGTIDDNSRGITGLGVVDGGKCGLVLGSSMVRDDSRTFAYARALGRALLRPRTSRFLLSSAKAYDERVARAFATELLAPAQGIKDLLRQADRLDELAFEDVANNYGVSSLLVRHQYHNQRAGRA